MRARSVIVVAVLAALASPAAAWAHATVRSTRPANGAVVARAPTQLRVLFDEDVRVGPAVAAIRNGGGSILGGPARVVGGRTLVVPLRRVGDGDYSVRWSIVSDDGHFESGVIAFAVGAGRAPPEAGLSAQGDGPGASAVAARWLFFAGILTAVGIALFALVVRPVAEERIALVLSSGAVLAAIGAADVVHRVGLGTRNGAALGAGFVAAVVVATGAAVASLDRRALPPALPLALVLAVVPAVAGHALDPGLPRVNVVADVLHVVGAAGWVGALVGLVVVREADRRRTALLALGGVVLLGATGVTRAAFELAHASQLWETSYGRALLVKTALLLAAVAAGWFLRARPPRRAAVELVVVAGLVVAVAVLVALRPGRNVSAASRPPAQSTAPAPNPPPPPRGAVVLARESGTLGVAVAAEPARTTAIVLSPAGGGLSGLEVRIQGAPASSCGSGCYEAAVAPGRRVTVEIAGFGRPRRITFVLPARAPQADALVRRVHDAYRALRSVVYVERLASDPTHEIVARWTLEAPNRIGYEIARGGQAIVVGARRWDRSSPTAPWRESPQTVLPQPVPQWTYATNAHVIAQTADETTVSFADPTVPAFFTLSFDRRTLRPRVLRMTAPSHFMTDRYLSFNEPRAIHPPR